MSAPKKPSAKSHKKPAPKKRALDDDDDDSLLDNAYSMVPSKSTSRMSASTAMTAMTAPTNTNKENPPIQPLDVGRSFDYTKNEKHIVEANIHVLGYVMVESVQARVADDGRTLLWRRATPPTFFSETIDGMNGDLERNHTNVVALRNSVKATRRELGINSNSKFYFGDNWQPFKLPVKCQPRVHKMFCIRVKGGEIFAGGVRHDQYNTIIHHQSIVEGSGPV